MFSGATHLGRWREGETLYSLCARHHHISGNPTASATSAQLFGTRRASAHDLPNYLDAFVSNTAGSFGAAEDIAIERTILPFYLRFLTSENRKNVLAAVRAGGCGALKARLGLLASRFGAAHPLKICRSCDHERPDLERGGHWRLDDQWPGLWSCLRCSTLLQWTTERINGGNRFGWLLPRDCAFLPASNDKLDDASLHLVSSFSSLLGAFAKAPPSFGVEAVPLLQTYRRRLFAMGLADESGRLAVRDVCSLLMPTTRALKALHEFATLPDGIEETQSQFIRLLRGTLRPAHPLRHLILIHALFGDWKTFLSSYTQAADGRAMPSPASAASSVAPPDIDPRQHVLLASVCAGTSVSAASRQVGIAVQTGIAWAASAGLRTPTRPSLLTEKKRRRAITALLNGSEKARVAQLIRMSNSTINMLLKSEPGLGEQWRGAVLERRRSRARSAWSSTASRLDAPSAKQLRDMQPAVFAWLYRNDRAWLESFNSQLKCAPRSPRARVNWDERDRQLAQSVCVARDQLSGARPARAIRLAAICDQVPGLKARLSQLDQLPLTRKALGRRQRSF